MPFNDWIVAETSTTPAPPPPPDTPRTFAMVAAAVPVGFTERFRLYSSIGELDDDGWTGSESAYLAIADMFAQTPTATQVSAIVMIRRDPAVAEAWIARVLGTTDGDFKLFDDAVEISTFTASSSTDEQIRDGLIAGLIAGYTGAIVSEDWTVDVAGTTDGVFALFDGATEISTFTASTSTAGDIRDGLIAGMIAGYTGTIVDADSLTASIDSGVPFSLSQTSPTGNTELTIAPDEIALSATQDLAGIPIILSQTSPAGNTELDLGAGPSVASVGIYDDLDAAYPLSPFWAPLSPAATDPENDEARRWVHADTTTRRNFFFAESADVGIWDPGDTDNLAATWFAAQYNRVSLMSHTVATDYIQASSVGRLGGAFPGARAWHYFEVSGFTTTAGISPRTSTATATMIARRVSYTERNLGPASGLKVFHGAVPKSGEFVYHRWAEDWWWYTIRVTVDAIMKSDAGVNLDEAGLQEVADAVKIAMVPLVDNFVIAANYTVTFTPIADVPAGEIAIGDYKTTGKILASATITPKLRAIRVSAEFALGPAT